MAEKALEKAEEGDDETATAAATETVKSAGDAWTAKDVNRGRKDLYRTLAHGLAGTAMNGWKGVLTEDDLGVELLRRVINRTKRHEHCVEAQSQPSGQSHGLVVTRQRRPHDASR